MLRHEVPHTRSVEEIKRLETRTSLSRVSFPLSVDSMQMPARAFLAKHHWPVGLQEAMVKSCKKMPVRFFITDDSGSMLTNDGNRLVGD